MPSTESVAPDAATPTTPSEAQATVTDVPESTSAAMTDALPVAVEAAALSPAAPKAEPGLSPAACARELRQRFPALFGDQPKPIKLRIQADIQERAPGVFTKKALSIFLHRYTGSTPYLIALSKSRQRFDLDGQPAGELAEEHTVAAAEELKRRRAAHEERRAIEDEQRRNRAQLLRDFETTTLTRANFCALKGVPDGDLDELLDMARREVAEWEARRPTRPEGRPGRPAGRPGPGHRAEGRREAGPAHGGSGRPPRRQA